ncbi:MAG: alpha-L-fucosidase [Bacteroidales bacterium]|nr:alpha-L-fucosidase [Bacteroidales bacterium]
MKIKLLFLSLYCLLFSSNIFAQGDVYERSQEYEPPTDKQVVQKLSHWQDLKFGVLFHWGLYAVPGIVESWSICNEDWITRDTTQTYQQYKDWYWGQCHKFKPTKFNPEQWAHVMKDAGMKYMIFTTKHHDGFCMFDSRLTDFSIANYAFKDNPRRDVAQYVFDAFRKQDFMIGAYFSKPDWHSQYYWWDVYPQKNRNVNYDIQKYPAHWQMFKDYTYRQIEELMSRYGRVDILWLDGGWVCKENNQDIDMPRIAKMGRHYQPGLIMVDRTIHGPYENYQTPERTIPEKQLPYPWESCIPLSDDWGYVKHPNFKSPQKIINSLIEIVAKGGSLVLGVGPTPEGVIQPEVIERLKIIGTWMRENGTAIYNTRSTPIYNSGNTWFTADKNGKTLYAIYRLDEKQTLPDVIKWEGNIPIKGTKIHILCNGTSLKWKAYGNAVSVFLPKGMKNQSFAMTFQANK